MAKSDEQEYVSGEQYNAMRQISGSRKQPNRKVVTLSTTKISWVVSVIVLCLLSFWGGVSYQKHHSNTSTVAATGSNSTAPGATGRFGGARFGGGLGQVTAISSSSLTVVSQRTATSTTFTITSATTITDNGQAVTASDIQTGDTVLVRTSGSGNTTATSILVNPSFGGGSGGSTGSGSQTN